MLAIDQVPHSGARSENTQERLLDAAETLFSQKGFSSTNVREITCLAECNVAAVNYHFRSKDGLYQEMVRRKLSLRRQDLLAAIERAMAVSQPSLRTLLSAYICEFLGPFVNESSFPNFVQIIQREFAAPHLPHAMIAEEMIIPIHGKLVESLCRLTPTLSPNQAMMSVFSLMGQLMHLTATIRMHKSQFPPDFLPDTEVLTAHIIEFTALGLEGLVRGNCP